jgi:hypothetical protein
MQLRIPVISAEGQPLMPTTPQRARRWIEVGKAVKKWSDVGLFYVQLVNPPSDAKTQPISVGIDPGKLYSGIGIQSSKVTLFTAHLVLPFKTVKDRMEQRAMMRCTRRGRRINRTVEFKLRNHRQKRFSNRRGNKLPPSIRANRQLELRVVTELCKVFPIAKIVYEYVKADVDLTSGRKKARSGKGFSAVMVGQKWMIEQLSKLAPVVTQFGWQTAQIRERLGLIKIKDKKAQTPQSHAIDGIALASSEFVGYEAFRSGRESGHARTGFVEVTPSVFKVIRRPPISRRQLHLFQPAKGGERRKYGGTVTRHGFRKGDLVNSPKGIGYVSGDTERQISVSDSSWKRLGQITTSKITLIRRNNGLVISD